VVVRCGDHDDLVRGCMYAAVGRCLFKLEYRGLSRVRSRTK
jgi:hypothetical protein